MKKFIVLALTLSLVIACGKKNNEQEDFSKPVNEPTVSEGTVETTSQTTEKYDAQKGEGKYDKVELGAKIDQKMASEGEKVAGLKCISCHKLTDEQLIGPGWKGVTQRRTPEWIMNFISNPDPMIDKDPELKKQLEICKLRMPNQNLTDTEARNILEYMRKNDGA
ncbi:cytochrome C [Flavobacterium columnare]|uniref:Cytochrome c class I n=2 Tax=Flavobacterium columnare TaxID=996 RepID=G8X9Y8_FLACA|nr:cytochrome c [Flavobacterium columnare]AEW85152.1 cytochrome c class I [Flavobacterium columnare ATCC 49512]AMO19528.1 cytochrome c [Flavobacterium columnare]ANO49072.1 cytochrome c class I [Flavobacterium columnare]APT22926.1 cytochrome C [Flavobacterium columnare]MBF6653449.1 cytochrome c [Flavobacterium columnare]